MQSALQSASFDIKSTPIVTSQHIELDGTLLRPAFTVVKLVKHPLNSRLTPAILDDLS